jgi:hypothetical protein
MINDNELEIVLRTSVESSARQGTTSGHLSRGTAENQESVRIAYIRAEIRTREYPDMRQDFELFDLDFRFLHKLNSQ